MARLAGLPQGLGVVSAVDADAVSVTPLVGVRLSPPMMGDCAQGFVTTTGTARLRPVFADVDTGAQWEDDTQDWDIPGAGAWTHQFDTLAGYRLGFRVLALGIGAQVEIRVVAATRQ